MNTPAAAAGASTFVPEVVRVLTRPTIKLEIGTPVYVLIQSRVVIGKEIKSRRPTDADKEKKREPAHVADVVNLETGELNQLIVSAVVLGVLNDDYPHDAYVGKSFSIKKLDKKAGKDYFPYEVREIKTPANLESLAKEARAKLAGATDKDEKTAPKGK